MELAEQTIPVFVQMPEEGVCEIVLNDFDGYSVTIRKSLLADNRLEIEGNEFISLPERLYNKWFERVKQREREKKEYALRKKKLWIWHCYKSNIRLFWENSSRILNDSLLFATPIPFGVYGVPPLTLGIIVNAWKGDYGRQTLTVLCPKCKGKMLIYNMYGLPYNDVCIWSALCPDCGNHLIDQRDMFFVQRADILNWLTNPNTVRSSSPTHVSSVLDRIMSSARIDKMTDTPLTLEEAIYYLKNTEDDTNWEDNE